MQQYKVLEKQKEDLLNEKSQENSYLLEEKEKLMDIKREREFMVGILKEQNKRAS